MRRDYDIAQITINKKIITKLVIDPHVDKHADHINDETVKELIKNLDGTVNIPVKQNGEFSYFASNIIYKNKWYKLVWLLEDDCIYIGVITAYKDRRLK